MEYKIEAYVNGKIIFQKIYVGFSNPNQVVRKAIKMLSAKKKLTYMNIAVTNGYGEVWVYAAKDNNGKIEVWNTSKSIVNKNDVVLIFSGNKRIFDIVR